MRISRKEIEDNNIITDYFSPRRSSNGYIKIGLNKRGTKILSQATEHEITAKTAELEALRKKYSELENINEELEESKKKLSKKEKKELKKEKKKKKKEKQKLKDMPESSRILIGAIENYKKTYFNSKKDGFDGITAHGKSSKKDKKDQKPADIDDEETAKEQDKRDFNQRFDEPLTLLRQTIIEVDRTISDIDTLIKETKESRARNRSGILKDLILAKSSLFNNRTTNARSIGDLQKTRIDLELKKIKEVGDTNEKNRNIALISQAFPQLVGSGAKLLSDKDDKKKDKDKDDDRKKDKRKQRDYEENFDKRAAKLIRDGVIELSPHEASIDMEGRYRPAIKKSYKTDEWIVVALDNDNREIKGFKDKYPGLLPKKKHLNLVFDDERDIAKCRNTNNVYQVISVAHV